MSAARTPSAPTGFADEANESLHGAQAEAATIKRAAEGDENARQTVLAYLGSANPDLRRIMIGALHECSEALVWRMMLGQVSCQAWRDPLQALADKTERTASCLPPPLPEMAHPPASQRPTSSAARAQAWTSIVTAFAIDHSELERAIKQELLHTALAKSGMAIQKATGGLSRYRIHVRSASAYLLALRGEKLVITTLEELLDSAPPSWKLRAVEGLAALNDPQCGPPLVKALSSSDKTLHQSAWRALGELGERGEGALLDALHSPDQHVRWHAARGLGQLGNAQGVDTLAEGLLDESVEVRWAAAHALANLDMQAMPAVLRVITSHPVNEPLRQVALHALHGMQSQKAQQTARPVIEALRGRMAGILAPLEARRVLAAIEH